MNTILSEKALEAAKSEVNGMLVENWKEIQEAYSETYQNFCKQKDDGILAEKAVFRYAISLKVVQQPVAGDIRVKAAISWGVTHKDESEGKIVSVQPDLGMGD